MRRRAYLDTRRTMNASQGVPQLIPRRPMSSFQCCCCILFTAALVMVVPHDAIVVNAQAPMIRVAAGVMTGLDAGSPCTLIDRGVRLVCAVGVANAPKMLTFYKDLYASLPSTDKTIDYATTGWGGLEAVSIAGNSEQFLLIATGNAVFLGNVQVEASATIRPIRRLGQSPVESYFALFFSDRLVLATEHRYSPGTYLRALSVPVVYVGDSFIAAAMSLDDSIMLLVTKTLNIMSLNVSANGLGRVTALSTVTSLPFQLSVPWRDVAANNFYYIRERVATPTAFGTGGYREVYLSQDYSGPFCDSGLCIGCYCPEAGTGQWYILTESYLTPYCPGVRVTTINTTLGAVGECAVFDAAQQKFALTGCDLRSGSIYNPTRFGVGCSAPRNRGAPYLNMTTIQSNNLFSFPSGMEATDVPADAYGPMFSVPSFMSQSNRYCDATVVLVNGVVSITAYMQGIDCATSLSANTLVAGNVPCSANTRSVAFTLIAPIKVNATTTPRASRQFQGYKTTNVAPSYSMTGGDRAFAQITYPALNGSTLVTSASYMPSPLIPPLASVANRVVTESQLEALTFSQRYYFQAGSAYYIIDDVVQNGELLLISQGQSAGGRVTIYKRPTQRIQASNYFYATSVQSAWFNESNLYATCASQIAISVMVINTQAQDGVITSGFLQVAATPVYSPASMVLDSNVEFSGSTGATISIFAGPCSTPTVLTMQLALTLNPDAYSFRVNLTLLPGGQPLPTVGPTPAPTPPPPTRTKEHSTVTATLTEPLASSSHSNTNTFEETATQSVSLTQSLQSTQSDDTNTATNTVTEASRTALQLTPEPTISSKLPVFPPLPDNATNWTQVNAPLHPFPESPVLAIQRLAATVPPPSTYVVRVALPFTGVGDLFARIAPSVAFGSVLRAGASDMLLRTTNATQALMLITASIAVVVNPEVSERNLTSRIPLNVTVWGEVVQPSTNTIDIVSQGTWVYPLSASIPINTGPAISPVINCSRSVMRGGRFDLSLGSVLVHPLGMPLSITVAASGQQVTLPPSIRVDCNSTGSCGIRGVATDDAPIPFRIGGSDGYYSVFASCTLSPFYVPLKAVPRIGGPLVLNVKAATSFVLTIPLDVFVSSLSITMIAVTLDDGYPLPSLMNFEQPNTLRGIVPSVSTVALRVKAVDLYSEAYFVFYVNSTNHAPVVIGRWDPIRILAGVPFAALRYHSGVLFDSDPTDLVTCTVDLASIASIPWITVATVSPGTLQISGSPPTGSAFASSLDTNGNTSSSSLFPHDRNVTVGLLCSDGVSSVNASILLTMQQAVLPLQTAPLRNITALAEEVMQMTIDVSLFFADPTGGTVILGAVAPGDSGLAVWLQLQRVSDSVLQLSGVPPVDQAGGTTDGAEFPLVIKVRNVFGNETSATMTITVTATTWQLVQAYSALIYSLLGLLLTAFSFWFYWVPLVNTVRLPWRRVACPFLAPNERQSTTTTTTTLQHHDDLQEDHEGVVSFAVYKTCHDIVGYVRLSDKVAGRLRRCSGCFIGALASYWDLQISCDQRLPKWLYLRGDGRVVFNGDDGDDGIEDAVVVHEVNVYGVVLREYTCTFAKIAASLAENFVSTGEGKRGGRTVPSLQEEHDVVDVDDLGLLMEDVDELGDAGSGSAAATRGGDLASSSSLRDARRERLKLDVMRRQLTQQLQTSEKGITSHTEAHLDAQMAKVTRKIDALADMILQLSRGAPHSGSSNYQHRNLEDSGQFARRNGGSTLSPTLPLTAAGATGSGDDDILWSLHYNGELDPNRVRDPLAELNSALSKTKGPNGSNESQL